MLLNLIVTGVLAAFPTRASGDLLAIRVGRAETIAQGTIEHAVVLVEDGKIVLVGEDLPIARGIPVLDRPEWVVMPGLVNCYSRAGLDSVAGADFEPEILASKEVYPPQDIYRAILEAGVTTLGLYPAGSGVPGQAVAVRPRGADIEEMQLADRVYLKIFLMANQNSKRMLREAFEKLGEYDEKVKKAREKWEKDQEKNKKKSSKSESETEKKETEKKESEEKSKEAPSEAPKQDEDKEKGKEGAGFVPPEPEPKVKPFVELRDKKLSALIRLSKAADWLHLLEVIKDQDFRFALRLPLRSDIDFYEVAPAIGEKKLSVVMDPYITLQPNTRRDRNIPAEMAAAGAKVVLIPRRDSEEGHRSWIKDVGELVRFGLDRQVALAAVTQEAANVLGLGERLGSIAPGRDANLVFWNGDPFEPGTRVQAVMLEGEFVFEEVTR